MVFYAIRERDVYKRQVVFFGSVTHADGSSETVFSFLYNSFLNLFGQGVYWILVLLIGLNFILHVYCKYIDQGKHSNILFDVYSNDNVVHLSLIHI